MKVLLCHNYYQRPGGEDIVFADEAALLEDHGNEVIRFTMHNDAVAGMRRWELVRNTLWNRGAAEQIREIIRRERPDVMHGANTFPLMSPSVLHAASQAGVAVVQTLHNYRLFCPSAQMLRDGVPCNLCVGRRIAWPAVRYSCYRGSRSATATTAAMLAYHARIGTWTEVVDAYIAPSEYVRDVAIAGGLPAERITVKPNFLSEPPAAGSGEGGYFIYAGRLSPEKGIALLLDAWTRLQGDFQLRIVGDGPLAAAVEAACGRDKRIRLLGRRPLEEVCRLMGDAAATIVPSLWHEPFGRTVIESFAAGTPVIGSSRGALSELIRDGETGLLFSPDDPQNLAARLEEFAAHPARASAMRTAARSEFFAKYTPAANYPLLIRVYGQAIGRLESRLNHVPECTAGSIRDEQPNVRCDP